MCLIISTSFLSLSSSLDFPFIILARIIHKFSTVAPKPSGVLHRLRCRSLGLLDVPYSTAAVSSVARLVRTAFSTPRYKNLCIIRARETH